MQTGPILRNLSIGNSVAEFDDELERYFLETDTFRAFVSDDVDIIAGDKGTGKTAIYRYVARNYRAYRELDRVHMLSAFNPSGNPIFQRLVSSELQMTEGQYSTVWKAYVLSLAGNWLVDIADNEVGRTEKTDRLSALLAAVGLRSPKWKTETLFTSIVDWAKRLLKPTAVEVEFAFTPEGLPLIKPRAEFEPGELEQIPINDNLVYHEDALGILTDALNETETDIWILFDRLDEAFVGYPDTEIPALRALLRTYLDLQGFPCLRLKLFLRRDLFGKVTRGGFVNLTHINARRRDIVWDDEDLFKLLTQRVRGSDDFVAAIGAAEMKDGELFYHLFPSQVDLGERKPTTWNWMLSRIRDGNGVKPPRNLIDLVAFAREEQMRREERNPRLYDNWSILIEAESLKQALSRLSQKRIQDTLLAEAPEHVAANIRKFRDEKAEHNTTSLRRLVGMPGAELRQAVDQLTEVGFLEQTGESYKVPMLYRDGLAIKQGKGY